MITKEQLKEMWKKLTPEQKAEIKTIAETVSTIDLEEKIMKKLFPALTNDAKVFLLSHGITNLKEIDIKDLRSRRGYSQEIENSILSCLHSEIQNE